MSLVDFAIVATYVTLALLYLLVRETLHACRLQRQIRVANIIATTMEDELEMTLRAGREQ